MFSKKEINWFLTVLLIIVLCIFIYKHTVLQEGGLFKKIKKTAKKAKKGVTKVANSASKSVTNVANTVAKSVSKAATSVVKAIKKAIPKPPKPPKTPTPWKAIISKSKKIKDIDVDIPNTRF